MATQVYYSVGTSAADLKTGSPNITITGGVMAFSVAQTADIGVGDVVLANSISYSLVSKTDTSTWGCLDLDGTSATNIGSTAVTTIKRAFNSLNAALDSATPGAANVTHLNTLDLVSADINLNIPCYADGNDTNYCAIQGWSNNDSTRGVNVYTPIDTVNECNNRQRHTGIEGTGYHLALASARFYCIAIAVDYVTINGLEVSGAGANNNGIFAQTNFLYDGSIIKNNLVHDCLGSGIGVNGETTGSSAELYIINNIVYRSNTAGTGNLDGIRYGGSIVGQAPTTQTAYIYNNTVIDTTAGAGGTAYGISILRYTSGATFMAILKNNIVQDCTDGCYDFSACSGTSAPSTMDNCLADDTTADPTDYDQVTGSNNKESATVDFVALGSDNYDLAYDDTAAREAGVDLSGDADYPFADDIIERERPQGPLWDIGAFEGIYTSRDHSVGAGYNRGVYRGV